MSTGKRRQPEPGEFAGLVRYAAAVAEGSDPDEVRKIANRGREDEPWPPPSAPLEVARRIAAGYVHEGHSTLLYQQGTWRSWVGPHWAELDADAMRGRLYELLGDAVYLVADKEGELKEVPWNPNRKTIGDVLDALGAGCVLLPGNVTPPAQLNGKHRPGTFVSCANGLLDVDTGRMFPHTPRLYNLVSVPFDYDPGARKPKQWLDFLDELWPDDQESIDTLQEWFGYVISGRTNLQKALLLQGPARGGKGTIARVLGRLVGPVNVAGPTIDSLADKFGLAPLIGKSLAVVADARPETRTTPRATVERLLDITGEDQIDIDRKNRTAWSGRLSTRIMVLSNDLPRFADTSGTIVTRFITLVLSRSWLGHEDVELETKLSGELPGILNWALDGLARLNKRDKFIQPEASRHAVRVMSDATSPHRVFLRDRCKQGAGLQVRPEDLYEAWRNWCGDNGRDYPGTLQSFARDLHSVIPGLRTIRPRSGDKRERFVEGIALL